MIIIMRIIDTDLWEMLLDIDIQVEQNLINYQPHQNSPKLSKYIQLQFLAHPTTQTKDKHNLMCKIKEG